MMDEVNGSDALMRVGMQAALDQRRHRQGRILKALAVQGQGIADLEDHELERVRAEAATVADEIAELKNRLSPPANDDAGPPEPDCAA